MFEGLRGQRGQKGSVGGRIIATSGSACCCFRNFQYVPSSSTFIIRLSNSTGKRLSGNRRGDCQKRSSAQRSDAWKRTWNPFPDPLAIQETKYSSIEINAEMGRFSTERNSRRYGFSRLLHSSTYRLFHRRTRGRYRLTSLCGCNGSKDVKWV
jgi:hypothetical protein